MTVYVSNATHISVIEVIRAIDVMQAAKQQNTKSLGYQQRRAKLLEILPINGFNIADAARKVGYSASYADKTLPGILKRDAGFNRELDRLRAINITNSDDKIAALDRRLADLLDSDTMQHSNILKGLELYYRRFGALADKRITEDTTRASELTDAQVKEARAYTQWRLTQGREAG